MCLCCTALLSALLVSFPEAEVALIQKLNGDVGTLSLWDFQLMLANMNWMSSQSLNSSVALATPKGENMLGVTLQVESYSTSARTPASEEFRMSLPCQFLLNHGTGPDTSVSFFRHRQKPLCQFYLLINVKSLLTFWAAGDTESVCCPWRIGRRLWLQMLHKLDVSIAEHAFQVPGFSIFLLFSLRSQTQIYIKDIFLMLLVIKHIPAGDASKGFHLCEVPMA